MNQSDGTASQPYFPRLKDLRVDHDRMQKEIAAYLGIDQRVYSNYETGKREIPIRHLIRLADFYGVSLDYLVGRVKIPVAAAKGNGHDL